MRTSLFTHFLLYLAFFCVIHAQNNSSESSKRDLQTIKNTSTMIDQILHQDFQSKEIVPNQIVDDATFLRRAYLKIIGRTPTYEETVQFFNDTATDKRETLVDKLVYSPGFNSHLFNFWADMLRLKSNNYQHGLGWHVWIREAVEQNLPYDKFVHKMLSATGHTSKNPAVGYYLRDRNMLLDNISNSVQVFLGTQIGCAQCHDHPFEDWTQKEYYSLAAFAGKIDYKSSSASEKINETITHIVKEEYPNLITGTPLLDRSGKLNREYKNKINFRKLRKFKGIGKDLKTTFKEFSKNEISLNSEKTIKLPHDYQYNDGEPGEVVQPNVIFGTMPQFKEGENKLVAFADWVTAADNSQFTKTIANRLWKRVFGYALAEPVDDWSDSTKVSHPEALALVENILKTNQYNIRETLRILYHTHLFQRQVSTEEVTGGKTYDFKGPILQRLSAEQIHDSFITLAKGNIDFNKNEHFEAKWDQYSRSIDYVLSASPQEIIEIDETIDKTEEQKTAFKRKRLDIETKMKKALADGNISDAENLKKQLQALRRGGKNFKMNKDSMMSSTESNMSMIAMSTSRNNKVRVKELLRASEKPSPAYKGSLLTQFGASDRMTPDASSSHASIPQVLTLLNGYQVSSAIYHKEENSIRNLLRNSQSSDEKLDILYLSIYNCYPSDKERSQFKPMMGDPKKITILAKAMLNSKRFLFIQ